MLFSKNFLLVKKYMSGLQRGIRKELEKVGGAPFKAVDWRYRERGGGRSLLIEMEESEGDPYNLKRQSLPVFERGGVNVSAVGGQLPELMATLLKTKPVSFNACGLSIVLHPYSPLIPTIHMNIRYFEMAGGDFWFGGGIDLTPYYPYPEDFRSFHSVIRDAVVRVYPQRYREFKEKCDQYFTLPHRQEMRGIGGVFFDYLKKNFTRDFDLIRSLGDVFLESYLPLIKKNVTKKYGRREKDFQLYRRGRYVEFNLLYDRGTSFGLKTGGRVDSILMSLPRNVRFQSTPRFPRGSFEKKMSYYYQPCNWIEGTKK